MIQIILLFCLFFCCLANHLLYRYFSVGFASYRYSLWKLSWPSLLVIQSASCLCHSKMCACKRGIIFFPSFHTLQISLTSKNKISSKNVRHIILTLNEYYSAFNNDRTFLSSSKFSVKTRFLKLRV